MEVSRTRALRGPNLWCRHTAIEAIVTCSEAESNIDDLPGFEQRLRARFPTIGELHPGTPLSLAHILKKAALALQAQAGCPVSFSRLSATLEPGVSQVVVEYSEEAVGRQAFELAQQLIQAALDDTPFDIDATIEALRDTDESERLGPSTGAIVQAAAARNIPWRRLTQGSLVQFGWGSRQRRIQAAELDSTSAVAESIAQDKDLTKKLLHAAGVPVPLGRPVVDLEDAWAAANTIGFALVQGLQAAYLTTEDKEDLLLVRYLDDWAYQSNVREAVRKELVWPRQWKDGAFRSEQKLFLESSITEKMRSFIKPYITSKAISKWQFTLPWNRTFEIKVDKH